MDPQSDEISDKDLDAVLDRSYLEGDVQRPFPLAATGVGYEMLQLLKAAGDEGLDEAGLLRNIEGEADGEGASQKQ